MATEIHQVSAQSPPAYEVHSTDDTKKEAAHDNVSDLEGSLNDESKAMLKDRAEATELTPVEAFKWNVDGDQSPCKSSERQPRGEPKLTYLQSQK